MIFSELNSIYYHIVSRIITVLLEGVHDEIEILHILRKELGCEETVTALHALKTQKWQLLNPDMTVPIRYIPTSPLTNTEKRWLKSVCHDPRIKLFDIELPGLDGVKPLFKPEDYRIYDRMADGDPFTDSEYIGRFRLIMTAIGTHTPLKLIAVDNHGQAVTTHVCPKHLVYSGLRDRFSLIPEGGMPGDAIELRRIVSCRKCKKTDPLSSETASVSKWVTIKIKADPDSTECILRNFSHYEKRLVRLHSNRYWLYVNYDASCRDELVCRILSLGSLIKVEEPAEFVELIRRRLKLQKSIGLRLK